jgi:hypothetical protein
MTAERWCPTCKAYREIGHPCGAQMPTLFDEPAPEPAPNPWAQIEAGRKARDAALEAVEEHAEPDWKELALEAVRATAMTRAEFVAEEVWAVGNLPQTRENRAMGPVMLKAARSGWITKTDRVRPSPSAKQHLGPAIVWRSNIFEGAR